VLGRVDAKVAANLPDKLVADLGMAWHGGAAVQGTIDEPGVAASLSFKLAAVLNEPAVERSTLHTAM
jgi:hypothetical protein